MFLALLALAAGVYAWVGNPLDPLDNRRFSSHAWRKASAESRARMARDVVRRVIKLGASETEVAALLGQPDSVSDRRGPGGAPLNGIHICEYRIGSWSCAGMDDAFVYIHLDASDRVVHTEIYGY
jgi:hypothetical protein